jgi:two-component system cell cycle sensor histidine kinase/response regulator CckA
VLTAEDPAQALHLAAEHSGKIHLLITDVVMPGMNGSDLAKRMAEQRPEMRCIFMSGFTADVIAQRGILEKDVDFLSKPFNRDQLAHKVREVLDRS